MGRAPNRFGKFGNRRAKKIKYITQERVLARLQIDKKLFRRICILKGVFPRLNPKIKKTSLNSQKLWFYTKDVSFLENDPQIAKFRELEALKKKYQRHLNRDEKNLAKSIKPYLKPNIDWDLIIKQRYPTFTAALEELDDCLSLLNLFSGLSDLQGATISSTMIRFYERLCREFEAFVIHTRALRKVFLSFKGIYYQADVCGRAVTWIVPYNFNLNDDKAKARIKIMKSFVDLYSTLLGFVNFRLYNSAHLVYPPKQEHDRDTGIGAANHYVVKPIGAKPVIVKKAQKKLKEANLSPELRDKLQQILQQEKTRAQEKKQKHAKKQEQEDEEMKQQQNQQTTQQLQQTENDEEDEEEEEEEEEVVDISKMNEEERIAHQFKNLFQGCVFFLSTETPIPSLDFVIRCFGGETTWMGDNRSWVDTIRPITHHVTDRDPEMIPASISKTSREFVQPQWIYDSINARIKLPLNLYAPGVKLPPHLSPFAEYRDDGYAPEYASTIRAYINKQLSDKAESPIAPTFLKTSSATTMVDGEETEESQKNKEAGNMQIDEKDDEEEEKDDEEEARYAKELQMEKEGITYSEAQKRRQEEAAAKEAAAALRRGNLLGVLKERDIKIREALNPLKDQQAERRRMKTVMTAGKRKLVSKIEREQLNKVLNPIHKKYRAQATQLELDEKQRQMQEKAAKKAQKVAAIEEKQEKELKKKQKKQVESIKKQQQTKTK